MSLGARTCQVGVVVLGLLLFAPHAIAATVSASSCSSAAVQAAITSASSGDTVQVPAGACTWSASVNIPTGKNITVRGAGIGSTTITRAGEAVTFRLNGSASRITGFTFISGQIHLGGDSVHIDDFRIDHNRFVGGNFNNSVSVHIDCGLTAGGRFCRGLVDNNIFEAGAIVLPLGFAPLNKLHEAWAHPTGLGGANSVYIEDNSFSAPSGATWHYIDTNYAGRFVFRFNTVTGMAAEVHSLQGYRGARAWEIYRNRTTNNTTGWTAGLIRGGAGVVWGNSLPSTANVGAYLLDNVRSWVTGYHYGSCNGTSTADGNAAGQSGRLCRDQIGAGRDVCLSTVTSSSSSATGWCAQAHEPSYFWLDRTPTGGIFPVSIRSDSLMPTHMRFNRDVYQEVSSFNGTQGVGVGTIANRPSTCTTGVAYWVTDQGSWNKRIPPNTSGQLYKCTATNTWTLYYTPYTYPYPLAGGSVGPPPAPSGLSVQ